MKGLLVRRATAAAIAALALAAVLLAAACGDGEKCVGGFVRPETGVCEAKCETAKCADGNKCVNNRCVVECDTHNDCFQESQSCEQAVVDDTGEAIQACLQTGRERVRPVMGVGALCPFGEAQCAWFFCPDGGRCDPFACGGNPAACVNGVCSGTTDPCVPTLCDVAECKQARYCPNGLQCDFGACGGNPAACKQACPPGVTECNTGVCEGTGAPCVFNTCLDAECHTMSCIGAGEGDANAYCANHDCKADDDCVDGFYCGKRRDPHLIQGTTKGNNATCGMTAEPPVAPADFNANGFAREEGPLCLMRNICRKRTECAPCETHLDCSASTTDVCVQVAGENVCARYCDTNSDCHVDEFCQPATCAATATAEECAGRSVCQPAAGSCGGTGEFCTPCLHDLDCGASGACTTGDVNESACVDAALLRCLGGSEADCADAPACPGGSNSECPTSPSGDFGTCLNENHGVQPTSGAYHKCFLPLGDAGFSCWP